MREPREETVDRVVGLPCRLRRRPEPISLRVVASAAFGILQDLVGLANGPPGLVVVAGLEGGTPVRGLDLLARSVGAHPEHGVEVA
jgi:hypothetical protein